MTKGIQRSTPQLRQVLEVLMHAGPDGEVYGYEVAEKTGLLPGSVYPILQRLHDAEWVSRRLEEVVPDTADRPPRVYYCLTAEGAIRASQLLSAAKNRKVRTSARPGWAGNGGQSQ